MIDGYFDPIMRRPAVRQEASRPADLQSVLISEMADSISLSSEN
jgi:hypothetical protein